MKEEINPTYLSLKEHMWHDVEIVYYGDENDPISITVECNDCDRVILSEQKYLRKE